MDFQTYRTKLTKQGIDLTVNWSQIVGDGERRNTLRHVTVREAESGVYLGTAIVQDLLVGDEVSIHVYPETQSNRVEDDAVILRHQTGLADRLRAAETA